MPDLASIGAVLSSLKHASDLARLVRDSGVTLADAESRLKLAEVIGSLADAKMGIADLKSALDEKDAEIARMKRALTNQSELKHDGVFYRKEGDPTPFCPRCWEKDAVCMHMAPEEWRGANYFYVRVCPECETVFKTRDAAPVSGLA